MQRKLLGDSVRSDVCWAISQPSITELAKSVYHTSHCPLPPDHCLQQKQEMARLKHSLHTMLMKI